MADRILIKNAIVLTQDPSLGELPRADILVEGDTIDAVGPNLSAEGAQVIDAEGDIVIPGFIDSHRHTWETSIRTCAPDYTLGAYFDGILDKFAPHYRRRRRLCGQPLGRARVGQRRDHDARRLVAHHEHRGSRPRGDPRPPGERDPLGLRLRLPEHLAPGLVVRARLRRQRPDDRRRPRPQAPEAVLQLRRRPHHDGARDARHQLLPRGGRAPRVGAGQGARPQHHGPRGDVPVRLHEDAAERAHGASTCSIPNTTYIHSSHLTHEEWGMVRDSGGNVSFAPADRAPDGPRLGAGRDRARDYDVPIGLSSDVATTASSDQFTQMHAIFASERGRSTRIAWDETSTGTSPTPELITSRQVLEMGDARRCQGRRDRRPRRARSRRARRPTS